MFAIKILINFFLILSLACITQSDFTKSCPFVYTVDLAESILLPNGSYLYNHDTIIPPQFVREYNYTILLNNRTSEKVQTHKRGCICAVKRCLPFCSDDMENFYKSYKSNCVNYGFSKNVTFSGGVIKRKHLVTDFYPIFGKVCANDIGYMMLPEMEPHNDWTLFEDSILLRHYDQRNLTIAEYCFDIKILNKDYQFLINPIVCAETIIIPWFKIWAMVFSIPFLIITIICYWTLTRPQLAKNKCFIMYLSCVSLSYTLICFYTISGINLSNKPCLIFGLLVYCTIIGYLTWTCILSYDTWKSLTDINDNQPSFGTYCLIGGVVPLLMTFLTFLAQISRIPDEWKPGMATDMCAVNTLRWSAVIYYYIPCIFVFVYSFTLYIWIVVFKKKHNEELTTLFGHGPEPLLERFILFFRIFIFMGISWSLDIASYFLRMMFGSEEYIIYIALDLFNAFHGFFIFLAFICRSSVLRQIKEIAVKRILSDPEQ